MIALRAKKVDYDVTYVDLRNKPEWFLKLSPHGKVPVLVVDGTPLFESNAIAEYLDETVAPRLHPEDPIARARNRAWTDFVPDFSAGLRSVSYADTQESMQKGVAETAPKVLRKLETALEGRGNAGPYFNGDKLSLVDCAYAPFLQRLDLVEREAKTGVLDDFPLVEAWKDALLSNESVIGSLPPDFEAAFAQNLERLGKYSARFIQTRSAAE